MAAPIRNPFYGLLLFACATLLVTILVYLVGWFYVPLPGRPAPAAPLPLWMQWIDRHALVLIAGEVAAIVVLGLLTIGLDRFFDPKAKSAPSTHDDEES